MFTQPLSVLFMFCSDSNQDHCSAAWGRSLCAAFPPLVYNNLWELFAPMPRHFIGLGTTAPRLLSRSHKLIYRPATLVCYASPGAGNNVKVDSTPYYYWGWRFRDLDPYKKYSLICVIIVIYQKQFTISWLYKQLNVQIFSSSYCVWTIILLQVTYSVMHFCVHSFIHS